MRKRVSTQLAEAMAAVRLAADDDPYADLPEGDGEAPAHHVTPAKPAEPWWPRGGAVARKVFNTVAPYNLVYGERYSGKTIACIHRIVRHCYENDDALAVIVTMTRRGATFGGPWEDLTKHILPEWADGIGLQGEGPNGEFMPKREAQSQTPYVWIATANGGWSRVILVSLQFGDQIAGKIKNMQFSMFFFDELTETDSDRFFLDPIQQLRRKHVPEKLFLAACNPSDEGPDHWVYKRFFLTENQDDPSQYRVFHLPIGENIYAPDVAQYIARIMEEGKTDPTAIERKIHGRWVRRPRGDGLLAKQFNRQRHVRGDTSKKTRLLPYAKWPIIKIGYDPGPANFNVSFMQQPPNREERRVYAIFDEIVHIKDHKRYDEIVREVLRKMNFWCDVMDTPFTFLHVADAAAFTQKDSDGKYECRKIQELAARELRDNADRYPRLKHIVGIRLRACPKPPGSVPARVMMMQAKLDSDEVLVSATCGKHIAMFEGLEENKHQPMHPLKDESGYIHTFDAASYVIAYDELGGRQVRPQEARAASDSSDFKEIG